MSSEPTSSLTGPGAAPEPPADHGGNALPIGHRLHEFEIVRLIGEGGFGIVYEARDTQLQRTVAIKEYMPASLAARGAAFSVSVRSARHQETFELGLRSFVNEARLLASFDHPALVKVYRFWEENGTAYMVMPYYQGPTLKTWLREQGAPPSEAWLKALLAPLMDALDIIHADHCYHRDIAPDNILLLGPNRPLLLDFGAARRVIGDATQALTVILKPGYAPVEQYAEVPSMKQGPWTDVYALSAVLYCAITGRAPTPAVGRMMKDEMVPASQAAAGRYSPAFLAAIDAGLAVHPERRPQNMAELRALLFDQAPTAPAPPPAGAAADDERTVIAPASGFGGLAPTVVLPPSPPSSPPSSPQTLPPPSTPPSAPPSPPAAAAAAPSRSPVLLAGAAAVLLAVGGAAWWWAGGSGAPAQEAPPQVAAASDAASAGAWVGASAAGPASDPTPAPSASAAVEADTARPQADAAADRGPFSIVGALEDMVRRADPLLAVNTLPDKSSLVIGRDRLLFRVKSAEPGYLYVFLAGTDSQHFYLLFPNAIDQDNRIQANQLVELPRKSWRITAGGPPGVNHIVTVVSPVPRDLSAVGLKPGESIPEFDLQQAQALWASATADNPFVGQPVCDAGQPCSARYGAALVRIEEVAR